MRAAAIILGCALWCYPINSNSASLNANSTNNVGLETRAEKGDVGAQIELGLEIYYGNKDQKNDSRARYWIERAASTDHPKALFWLAIFNQLAIGGREDNSAAFRLMYKAALSRDSSILNGLGVYYLLGIGVEPSKSDAASYLQEAAQLHDPQANLNLGRIFLNGIYGFPKDAGAAKKYLEEAERLGEARASGLLINLYIDDRSPFYSPQSAFHSARNAVAGGEWEAQIILGEFYRQGVGTTQNVERAYSWFSDAFNSFPARDAEYSPVIAKGQGVVLAATNANLKARYVELNFVLMRMYYFGDGVPKNCSLALRHARNLQESPEYKGHPLYPKTLAMAGLIYRDGCSVEKDMLMARRLLSAAAELGDAEAKADLHSLR